VLNRFAVVNRVEVLRQVRSEPTDIGTPCAQTFLTHDTEVAGISEMLTIDIPREHHPYSQMTGCTSIPQYQPLLRHEFPYCVSSHQ
jgi:hypothetical protein